jgi:CHRD domain-containing protein
MRNIVLAAALAAPAALVAGQALADDFIAKLTGGAEVPSVQTPATGSATITLDPKAKKLEWSVTYSRLSGPPTVAHFHGPAGAGVNAPPVVTLEGSLDSPISGSASLTDAQITDLKDGHWYLNIHTAANPKGEIRGQVVRPR